MAKKAAVPASSLAPHAPARIIIWIVTAPFELEGVAYAAGDQWAQPAAYQLVENHPTLGESGKPVFGFNVEVAKDKDRRPIYEQRCMVLPVAQAEAPAEE